MTAKRKKRISAAQKRARREAAFKAVETRRRNARKQAKTKKEKFRIRSEASRRGWQSREELGAMTSMLRAVFDLREQGAPREAFAPVFDEWIAVKKGIKETRGEAHYKELLKRAATAMGLPYEYLARY